jgi:hypothetical protein
MTDYKTEYSHGRNINTLDKGSYNDFGDLTPARQVLARQPEGDIYDIAVVPKGSTNLIYNEVSAIPVGSETLINSYTVPPNTEALFLSANVGGENRAEYFIKKNGITIVKPRLWYTEYFKSVPIDDLKIIASDKIEIFVINRGSQPCQFESTIGVSEYAV